MGCPSIAPSTGPGPRCSQLRHAVHVSQDHPGVLPDVICEHGKVWNVPKHKLEVDLVGWSSCVTWSIHDVFHAPHSEGSDANGGMSWLDFFLLMFPPCAIRHVLTLTNVQLSKLDVQDDMDVGELM